MILKQFGITLKRIEETDIEEVRKGRNKDFVRANHFYDKIINKEEQIKWFKKINNERNYYFIVVVKGKNVGIVYVSDIAKDLSTSKCGVFIYEKQFLNSKIPILAIYVMYSFFVEKIGIKETTSVIKTNNDPAKKINLLFGSKLQKINNEVVEMKYTCNGFYENKKKLFAFMQRISKQNGNLEMIINYSDKQLDEINDLI